MAHDSEPAQRATLPTISDVVAHKRPGGVRGEGTSGIPFTAFYVACLLLVVTLPVFAWLLVLGAAGDGATPLVTAPLWYLLVVGALAWLLGRLCRGQSLLLVAVLSVAPVLLLHLTLLRLSPATAVFANETPSLLSWGALGVGHLLAGPAAFPADYALLGLTLYVWWWCANDGAGTPVYRRAARRFTWSLSATLCATVVALAISATLRRAIIADLMMLLPALMLVGLLSLTLTRVAYERDIPGADPLFLASLWRQVRYAAVMAAMFTAMAVVIAFVLDPQPLVTLLTQLDLAQPVSTALHATQQALTSLLDFIARLFGLQTSHSQPAPVQYTDPSKQMCIKHPELPVCHSNRRITLSPSPPVPFLAVLIGLTALSTVCVALAAVIRSLRMTSRRRQLTAGGEERESLDALRLLRQQLREMVRPNTPSASAPGHGGGATVRALYGDVLRTAATHHLARTADETPYEYAARLRLTSPFIATGKDDYEDLKELSEAYAKVRYAEQEPASTDMSTYRDRVRRLKELFTHRS